MPRTEPFDAHSDAYDSWFERHADLYEAELAAIRELMPPGGEGVEVGVGSGQFAAPLGIATGVEPSAAMAEKARARGIEVHAGVAEALPFPDRRFDFVLMVTTICFVDDLPRSFEEAFRVVKAGGRLLIGFIDRESELGRRYESERASNDFYRDAIFFSSREVMAQLERAGFAIGRTRQTLLPGEPPATIREGFGQGGFIAIEAIRLIRESNT